MATAIEKQKELTRIYKRDGQVVASTVVKEARLKKSPIHDEFEWDDKAAAHEHRLSTARRMIRITPIRLETGVEQRLVHVPTAKVEGPTAHVYNPEGVYKPVSKVAKCADEYARALEQLMKQLRAIERSIRELQDAASGEQTNLVPELKDALRIARSTVSLMLQQAS